MNERRRTFAANNRAERGQHVHSAFTLDGEFLVLGSILDDLNEAEVDEAAGATVRNELGELERGGVLEESWLEKSERLLLRG